MIDYNINDYNSFSTDSYYKYILDLDKLSRWNYGTNIIITFTNGLVLEYNAIKNLTSFIKDLLKEKYHTDKIQLNTIKNDIICINAKRKGIDQSYHEIWNNKHHNDFPYNNIIKYNTDIYHQYIVFFLENKEFTKRYLSMHFPFDYDFIKDYWDYLDLGDAYYTVYINDVEQIFYSKFGLSYNKNIRWNSKLKARYDYGLLNPFLGEYVGTENYSTDVSEIDYMDIMLPLSPVKEIDRRNNEIMLAKENDYYDENDLFQEYINISPKELHEIFNHTPLKILINESIWENTLQYILDKYFCYSFFKMIKNNNEKS